MALRALLLLCALVAGCDRPMFTIGETCSLNTDCTAPLVCGLERCRTQCIEARDCPAGLRCLSLEQGNVCQLPDEAVCTLASDCDMGLECRFGTCTTACLTDRDCAPGSQCRPDPEDPEHDACIETLPEACVYNSDCPEPQVCSPDRSCRYECFVHDDCDDPLRDFCDPVDYRCYPGDAGI